MLSSQRKRGNINRDDFERAVLTDTAPTDVPIIFSNDGFHANLGRVARTQTLNGVILALIRANKEHYTIPYRYRIRLNNLSSRQLSLAHPAGQFRTCVFYRDYSHLIPYFCRHDDISLRRPVKVGSTFFYLNKGAERKRYKGAAIDMLLQDVSVRNPGSFFAYEGSDRFFKFFNSEEFVSLEKTFSMMRLTDVSKCFSSIYSHTLAWAVKDVQHGKEATSALSFANDFDDLMQFTNYNETNGIPVGAEVSRIFAEIILQAVEMAVLGKMPKHLVHGYDYVIRRYIDDYIVFANRVDILDLVQRSISECLLTFNLHLNESKTHTIMRPLQTRRSQIISGAMPAIQKLRDAVQQEVPISKVVVPRKVSNPRLLVRSFVNDVKVACVNGEAGYEDVSPFIIGAISSSIESLIGNYSSAPTATRTDAQIYARAFDTLLSSLYYFFVVHATVVSSYQVAKSTILAVRFFKENLPESAEYINERVRLLVQDVVSNPSLMEVAMTECVPIELLNIILASTELPDDYRTNVFDITDRILSNQAVDYFSIVSLLFYYGSKDHDFTSRVESKLRKQFLPKAQPLRKSQDAHLLLDLIACPHLTALFKKECAETLLKTLRISTQYYSNSFVREIGLRPWFVEWKQIDLLNHLRKKELRPVY